MNEEFQMNKELNRISSPFASCTCSALDAVYEDWIANAEDMSENDFLYNIYLPEKIEPKFVSFSSIQELNTDVDIEDLFLKDIGEISELKFLEIGKLDHLPGSDKYYIIFRKEIQEKSDEKVIRDKDQTSTDDKQKDETIDASKMNDEIGNTNKVQGRKISDLRKYQLLEQRIKNITESDLFSDWQMEDLWKTINDNNGEEEDECLDGEGFDESPAPANEYDEKEYISFKVLWAVIDFISDYFSDNFQYHLIKMAMTAPPNLIIQKLNDEWPVPKQLKEDVTTYVKDLKDKYKQIPVKIKKEKMPKEKKVKGDKKPGLNESESKDEKQIKTKKEISDKSAAKDKKSKEVKEKKKPPTEEELLLKKQLEELEAERQRQETNKKFLFPLQDAVDDEFFKNNFSNWKKVNWRKGKPKPKADSEDDDD
ncbi:hypothetical protein CBL_00533 [Carabus blaptoides fortunei]